jgi:hypothetical protein
MASIAVIRLRPDTAAFYPACVGPPLSGIKAVMADDEGKIPARAPNCLKCAHFKVTWDPRFPRSCGIFGFKCQDMPSYRVFESTGVHCPSFTLKEGLK